MEIVNILRNKKLLLAIASILVAAAVITGAVFGFFAINNYQITVQINDGALVTVEYGSDYKDAGASAMLFGKILNKNGKTLEVETTGTADTSKLGSYTIKYTAKYKKIVGQAVRTVNVVDTQKPSLVLTGADKVTVYKGEQYKEPGFSASDNYDGDITKSVVVSGSVDSSKTGSYELTYEITDSSGNKSTLKRTVTVKEYVKPSVPQDTNTVNPGPKTVYLTFDDGPGPYTEKLLNILDKYGVKATFFVTNNNPKYNYLFKRMANSGHAVAIHSATHTYKQIYKSEEAYFEDIYKMQNIIKEQTGITTYLLRFPGGSSNTTSSFNKGIMSRLVNAVTEKGFRYFDWNVTSGDAGETTSTAQVVRNVINGMASHRTSVVLQHDIKNFSVNAVEQIIQWGLANGYTFKVCDMTSPTAHHGVNN